MLKFEIFIKFKRMESNKNFMSIDLRLKLIY